MQRRSVSRIVLASLALTLLLSALMKSETTSAQKDQRPRARDVGVVVGVLPPGQLNAITDVPGVMVGHSTIVRDANIRTGVTAILPHGGNLFRDKVPGAVFIGNAFGKLAGSTQVNELGEIETPIMHWRIEEAELRSLIPEQLEIDTFDGSAWIGIIPFTMWDIRAFPPYLPAVPGLSSTHELNVRTYVHYNRVPGVWFFSLDCNSTAAVMAARAFYHLPYFNAHIDLEQHINTVDYALKRIDHPPAYFNGSWNIGETVPFSHPDSLEFFLTERYCLYAENDGELYGARIFHPP